MMTCRCSEAHTNPPCPCEIHHVPELNLTQPKRWTLAELSERLAAWDGGGSAEHQACMDFLEWLEGAGE